METTGPTSRSIQRIYININSLLNKILMHASNYLSPNFIYSNRIR